VGTWQPVNPPQLPRTITSYEGTEKDLKDGPSLLQSRLQEKRKKEARGTSHTTLKQALSCASAIDKGVLVQSSEQS